ncbi:MAG: fasciclin domain-containing protein [Planctomycetota bacterium]|jgi:hypothetical protein
MHDTKQVRCVIALLAALLLAPVGPAWAAKDIVDTAVEAGSFNTLVAAVKAAGLVETLKGPGPLTVFAPTDEAFAKLPEGALDDLLKPANKQKLVDILTYHVVPGRLSAKDVSMAVKADTVQGATVLFAADKSGVRVDGGYPPQEHRRACGLGGQVQDAADRRQSGRSGRGTGGAGRGPDGLRSQRRGVRLGAAGYARRTAAAGE